ncbi:polysaccharide deacetylase family protein [Proteiniclasticum sp. C24MP]|uniref:polysaccharide deacetylase family protein n=1 Tax=Proteiniclasticum sp. C24MP TaxID=3374101 RepID=UPI003754FC9B
MDTILFYLFIIYSILPNIYFRFFAKSVRRNVKAGDMRIAFTFDDGPDPRYTPQVLDLLKKNNVKATFFVLGEKAKENPEIIRRIVDEGHSIGLHANKHIGAPFRTYKAMKDDFFSSVNVLQSMGIKVHLYRPPWGLVNIASSKFIHQYDFEPVLWSIHASDWSRYVDETHIENILTQKVKPGDIILLHDGRGAKNAPQRTINALGKALPVLKEKGYHFVKLVDDDHTIASA